MKECLLGKTLSELQEITVRLGLPAYAAGQVASWLYQKRVDDIGAMTNLSKAARAALAERYEVGRIRPVETFTSCDGTRKYLFPTATPGKYIETVMIPQYEDGSEGGMARATACVSSQIGCKMGCRFCMTGRGGFHGNLSAAAILSQPTSSPTPFSWEWGNRSTTGTRYPVRSKSLRPTGASHGARNA